MKKPITLTPQTVAVIKAINGRSGDISGADISKETGLPSGSLYPILVRLEKAGWLSSEWENGKPTILGRPRRRFYRITDFGQQEVLAIRDALKPQERDV